MNIAFPNGTLNIYHKSQMGNLKDVKSLLSRYRDTGWRREWYMVPKKGGAKMCSILEIYHFIIYCAEMLSPKFPWYLIDGFYKHHIFTKSWWWWKMISRVNEYLNKLGDRVAGKDIKGYLFSGMKFREKILGKEDYASSNFNSSTPNKEGLKSFQRRPFQTHLWGN